MCVDPGVAFGDLGGGVLHSVKFVSPCGWHPVDSSVHFRTFGWQHGPCDACGLTGCLIVVLNAEPPSIGMAVRGQGALTTRVSDGRAALLAVAFVAAMADPHLEWRSMAVTCWTVRPGQRAAVSVLMGTASPGAQAFRAPEMRTASGLRVRRCVWLSGVKALTGAISWRATLSAISCPTVAAGIPRPTSEPSSSTADTASAPTRRSANRCPGSRRSGRDSRDSTGESRCVTPAAKNNWNKIPDTSVNRCKVPDGRVHVRRNVTVPNRVVARPGEAAAWRVLFPSICNRSP